MSQDPNDILSSYYASTSVAISNDDAMLQHVYNARSSRARRSIATLSGFIVTATATSLLLAWAAAPIKQSRNDTASAIARYQMINSGLVQRSDTKERPR